MLQSGVSFIVTMSARALIFGSIALWGGLTVYGQDIQRGDIEKTIQIKAEELQFGAATSEMQPFVWERKGGKQLLHFDGWRKDFANGRIYWTAATGPKGVRGEILARYDAEGAERGRFGFPTADEASCDLMGQGSRYQLFVLATIYMRGTTRETSVHELASAGDIFSTPACVPDPLAAPEQPARFRVILTGFTVGKQTSDHILESDGKGDEVYIVAEVAQFESSAPHYSYEWRRRHPYEAVPIGGWLSTGDGLNGRGRIIVRRSLTSIVMGDDSNQEVPRIRAGRAGLTGGLITGDNFPNKEPWKLESQPTNDRLPMLLWEGELGGGNMVIILPTIWEWDNGNVRGRNDFKEAADFYFKVGTQRDDGFTNSGFGERDIAGAGDRPIGYPGSPAAFRLDLSTALDATRDQSAKRGPGVFEVKYSNEDASESYTLFIKIEQMPPREEPRRQAEPRKS